MDFIRQYKGLDREIYYLAAIRCINAIGRMFVFPYTSLLLAEFVGLSPVQIGYYMLVRSIINAISHAVGGKLSDHFSRKKVIIISYILEIVSMILAAAFFRSTLLMLMLLVGGGIANVPLPAISALTLDKCPRAVRTESLSLLYLSSNIGSAVGPLIAGLLFYRHTQEMFYVMAAASVVVLLMTAFLVSDARRLTPEEAPGRSAPPKPAPAVSAPRANADPAGPARAPQEGASPADPASSAPAPKEENYILMILRNPLLAGFVFVLGATSLCYVAISYLLPLQFTDILGMDLGSRYFSFIWTINGFCVVFLTPVVVSLTKRHSLLGGMAFACLLYAVGFGVYGFTQQLPWYYTAVLVWTIAEILFSTGGGVFIANESPDTHKGRSMACYEMARDIGRSIGPLIFGFILERSGYGTTWRLIALICIALFFLMLALIRHQSRRRSPTPDAAR